MSKLLRQGFTLIELIIVIVLVGILAATALPRFADFQNRARLAATSGVAGALGSAVSVAHAEWLAAGMTGAGTIALGGNVANVTMSAAGWPEDGVPATVGSVAGTMTDAKCNAVLGAILTNPPRSIAGLVANCTNGCQFASAVSTTNPAECTYTDTTNRAITYNITTGNVIVP